MFIAYRESYGIFVPKKKKKKPKWKKKKAMECLRDEKRLKGQTQESQPTKDPQSLSWT